MTDYLAENLRYLIWASKQKPKNCGMSYSAYIDVISDRCQIGPDRFRSILSGSSAASDSEIQSIIRTFLPEDADRIPYLNTETLFSEEIEENGENLIMESILYLLNSIPWGKNQDFIDELKIRASTLTRWKSGKMKPSRYYKEKICKYFGISDADSLKHGFLFLGLSPTTTTEKRLQIKRLIDKIDCEKLEMMYPAIVKLLQ